MNTRQLLYLDRLSRVISRVKGGGRIRGQGGQDLRGRQGIFRGVGRAGLEGQGWQD